MQDDLTAQVEQVRQYTAQYAGDKSFEKEWSGLSETDVLIRTQQQKAFVSLVSSVHGGLSGLKILDVGCGAGRWLRWYLELGADVRDVIGVDVSDARFASGRAVNPLLQLVKTDGLALPFQEAHFDMVTQWVCFMCMPTVELRRRTAGEMLRVLKPGGFIFWWDVLESCVPGYPREPIHPRDYWPGLPVREMPVAATPRPSECMLPGRFRRWIGPIADRWRRPARHLAALVGPKP